MSTRCLVISLFFTASMVAGCVFDSGPELSSIPPFSPVDSGENNGVDVGDAGLDVGDMQEMIVDTGPDLAPDMPDPPDMQVDMQADMHEPDMNLPGPYGNVCPGSFEPPASDVDSCDLILQDCPTAMESTNCDLTIIQQPPDIMFAPRCVVDGEDANFTLQAGDECDPASDVEKCRKGLECSQIGGENRCRRFCILEDARGCDSNEAASWCAPTGVGPLDSSGIGYCAVTCDDFD